MGKDLAPEALRICPGLMERRRPGEILVLFDALKSEILQKSGAARAKDKLVDHQNRDFWPAIVRNEDHAKMTRSRSVIRPFEPQQIVI